MNTKPKKAKAKEISEEKAKEIIKEEILHLFQHNIFWWKHKRMLIYNTYRITRIEKLLLILTFHNLKKRLFLPVDVFFITNLTSITVLNGTDYRYAFIIFF